MKPGANLICKLGRGGHMDTTGDGFKTELLIFVIMKIKLGNLWKVQSLSKLLSKLLLVGNNLDNFHYYL